MKTLLRKHWQVESDSVKAIQENVFLIRSNRDRLILKRTMLKRRSLDFVCSTEVFLGDANFPFFAKLLPTVDGKNHAEWNGACYTLHAFLPGEVCDFDNENHLAAAATTLAKFHRQGRFPGTPPKNRDTCLLRDQRMKEKIDDLQKFYRQTDEIAPTSFIEEYREHAPDAIQQGEQAMSLLEDSAYLQLANTSRKLGKLSHGDVAARNFIINNGDAFLIDFDYCCIDLPAADLARLTKRALKNGRNQRKKLKTIGASYQRYAPLSGEEKEVLLALILFPQKLWRCAQRYFRQGFDDEAQALQKLRQAMDETTATAQWIHELKMILEGSL